MTITINEIKAKEMTWHTPPECQGQPVVMSYASGRDGNGYKQVYDKASRTSRYYACDMADCGCVGECNCWEPWNRAPSGYDWVEVRS